MANCGCSCENRLIEGDSMAIRAGFAAAALLGVVTNLGTGLWLAAVLVLFGLVVGLVAVEALPSLRRGRG
jgi:hypothetical protein